MFQEGDIGVLPPLGVYDPLGLIETRDMRRFEIMEIKHGRAAMLGFLHVIAIEAGVRVPGYLSITQDLKFSDVPAGCFASLEAIPTAGWLQIMVLTCMQETGMGFASKPQADDAEAGDIALDSWVRYDDPEVRTFKLNVERQNGRAAMLGMTGCLIHELLGVDALYPTGGLGGAAPPPLIAALAVSGVQGSTKVARAGEVSMFQEGDIGVLPPLGVYDPLGLIETRDMRRFEIMEIKHGRAAMLAFLHIIFIEAGLRVPGYISISQDLKFSDIPSGCFASLEAIPTAGWLQIMALTCMQETGNGFASRPQTDDKDPGDIALESWKRYADPEVRTFKLNVERQNGRAAMLGVTGCLVHELLGVDALYPTGGLSGDAPPMIIPMLAVQGRKAPAPVAALAVSGETPADLQTLAKKLNPAIGFYDPLLLSEGEFWETSNEATIGFIRHSEIKHGRIAMAGFVGFCAHANGVHFPWKMPGDELCAPGVSPVALWQNQPVEAKLQIIVALGIFEIYSEAAAAKSPGLGGHYMRGGKPGYFPPLKADKGQGENGCLTDADGYQLLPHPVPLNLYDPFGFSKNKTDEQKAKGLQVELNNGRLAMIGLMGFLSEGAIPGSVPLLKDLIPASGEVNVMSPLDFTRPLFG